MEERDVVRAKRIEFVDDAGNGVGYIGSSPSGGNKIGFAVNVEQAGRDVLIFAGTQDGEPVLLISVTTSEGQVTSAMLGIGEDIPMLHLKDAAGNTKMINPLSSD
jgi:hypothetical protein